MRRNFIIEIVIFTTSLCSFQSAFSAEPEEYMDPLQMILHWGYHAEEHTVVTDDGYILNVQRIPHGKNGTSTSNRPVMLMMHGLVASATNWIINLPNESAGFIFADAGFDVWLANCRGNTYSRRHKKYTVNDNEFWRFSWDEMAKYDLPAIVNYILDKTGQPNLYYMGHSQGTMIAFAKFSTDPDFQKKVKRFFALAPVATLNHIQGALSIIAPFTKQLEWFLGLVGVNEFTPHTWLMNLMANTICGWHVTNPLCDNLIFLLAGPNSHQLNDTRLPVYVAHTPAGTSTQNVVHFGQIASGGKFQMFDFEDTQQNQQHYGLSSPPVYPIEKVNVSTYLFWGEMDWLATGQDVRESIAAKLDKNALKGVYSYKHFNHMDFIWGLQAAEEIYKKILLIIKAADF